MVENHHKDAERREDRHRKTIKESLGTVSVILLCPLYKMLWNCESPSPICIHQGMPQWTMGGFPPRMGNPCQCDCLFAVRVKTFASTSNTEYEKEATKLLLSHLISITRDPSCFSCLRYCSLQVYEEKFHFFTCIICIGPRESFGTACFAYSNVSSA